MLNVILIVVIILILACLCFFNFKRESFDSSSTCSFFPENNPNIINSSECYQGCLKYYMGNPTNNSGCIEQGNSNNCIQKCKNFIPSSISANGEIMPNHCTISDNDISGSSMENCISKCENYGGNVCKNYKKLDINGSVIAEGTYDVSGGAEEYASKCNINDPVNIKYCSPCVQKCNSCDNSCKCTWKDNVNNIPCDQLTLPDTDINFDSFNFMIRAIPDNHKIIVVWDIDKNNYNIKEFLIMINKKGNSEIVKTIKKKFNNIGGNFSYTIENLNNNVPYIINVTAISNNNKVKMSNTLEVTPSEVNIINFSQFNKSKRKDTITTNLFENIMGKTFEINL